MVRLVYRNIVYHSRRWWWLWSFGSRSISSRHSLRMGGYRITRYIW